GEWLASLFASPALRFGTLALLLVGIAGLALIVMRQQKHEESGLVARNNGRASTVEEQPSLNHANSSVADTAKTATTDSSSANASTSSARVVSEPTPQNAPAGTLDDTRQQSSVSSTKAQSPAQVGGVTGDLSQSVNGQRGANAERPENQPAAPPQASAPATTAGATAQANEADELRARTAEEQRRQDERAYGRGNSAGAAGAAAPSSRAVAQTEPQDRAQSGALARPRRRGSGEDRESPDATTKNNVDIGEIRRVAGHQFRRQGSAWVDTAYRSSMSTTNVSRGSDRYRSLVADAPEIRTIADQLGGEIIIVSNGRAYKIH
ncbi:MAG TPA: hypothetical protein VK619_18285, partial [Pyrinomonadaceae bacterium]|nr:hypothetical protein [Pyrinomonadaceae bacterium]